MSLIFPETLRLPSLQVPFLYFQPGTGCSIGFFCPLGCRTVVFLGPNTPPWWRLLKMLPLLCRPALSALLTPPLPATACRPLIRQVLDYPPFPEFWTAQLTFENSPLFSLINVCRRKSCGPPGPSLHRMPHPLFSDGPHAPSPCAIGQQV